MSRPWMPLYVADYKKDTGHLGAAEHGAYLLLIMHYWATGGLPDNDRQLARIACMSPSAWKRTKPTLVPFFYDGWKHKRIDDELAKTAVASARRAESGLTGAVRKWGHGEPGAHQRKRSERLSEARQKGRHTAEEWTAMVDLCGQQCARCQVKCIPVKDHIVPIYKGGSDAIDNLQPLCGSCNSSKGPDETDFRPPEWRERLAERLANAWQTPGISQPQSHLEEKEVSNFRRPGEEKRKGWSPPRHGATSTRNGVVYVLRSSDEWKAYADDYREAKGCDPPIDAHGGRWFKTAGEPRDADREKLKRHMGA